MKNSHILIIDDEATLRKTLARILQQAGFDVTTAENAEQGIAFLKTSVFDLIFTDLRMPGIAGLEALKFIHAHHPNIPVVLFTAQPDVNSAVEALRHGATDYLLKPLMPEAIIERTKTILKAQKRENRKREIALQIVALQAELKTLESQLETNEAPSPVIETERYLKRGPIVLDLHAHRVAVDEELLALPPTSFDYLLVLMRHSPNVVDFQTLVAEAQGYAAELREAQELSKWHIHQIRQALEKGAQKTGLLINVRGTGYKLVAD
ncbi:MAG: response regulator transcription factor [Anaerolineales bacterium]|nr:response regulator transcription factor [Anaerolineales bacterium]